MSAYPTPNRNKATFDADREDQSRNRASFASPFATAIAQPLILAQTAEFTGLPTPQWPHNEAQSQNPFARTSQAGAGVLKPSLQAPISFEFGTTAPQFTSDRPATSVRPGAHSNEFTARIEAAHDFFKPTPSHAFGSVPQYKVRNFVEHTVDFMLPEQEVQSKRDLIADICQRCEELRDHPEDVTPRTWAEMLDNPSCEDAVKTFMDGIAELAVANIPSMFQRIKEKNMLLDGAIASMEQRARPKMRPQRISDLQTVANQAVHVYPSKETAKTHRTLFTDLLASLPDTAPCAPPCVVAVEKYYYSVPGKFDTPIGCTWVQLVQHEQACGSRALAAILADTVLMTDPIEIVQEKLYKRARSAAAALAAPKPGRLTKKPVRPRPVTQAPVPALSSIPFSFGTQKSSSNADHAGAHNDVEIPDAPLTGASRSYIVEIHYEAQDTKPPAPEYSKTAGPAQAFSFESKPFAFCRIPKTSVDRLKDQIASFGSIFTTSTPPKHH
ncbi:hypothetical protein P171DRAFT_522644 [Karstenula rhodostoma CBS 690.94]|uniref:Uncharacterized protein n=1 Tax=Karstenula rhodostoma CBS 690.94 TaxID=1392251 RepID=A0A9P4UB55_9PLEO|nr:hypothetical protein P171DRAFT_522644 [Karstenula rhodostoma CBS 690.94]